ncbi:hypothetical protein K469DRAFT_744985 [Zopfia rhizophila CBS 207.26]|uniref:Telomere-associated protein Rif1 N-terminal domain-containing protein n=1 Tax=Zopfia rhizophila CBS 207.26 TaxID=1314779 RepID=A0A6A6ETX8_9PEZI|nr:hypothetical protein K469DRAFT_744985 [Zopfia rhizophila CBS 207.26]
MVFSTSKFESFAHRPPTPPKDLGKDLDEALRFLDDPFGTKTLLSRVTARESLLNTPEQSPSSGTETGTNSRSRKKRVNFELPTCTIPNNGLIPHQWTPLCSSPLRPLPQTRVSKPLKSILKAYEPSPTPPPTDEGAAAHKFQSFPEMLESVVKMLAKGSRPSKLDAYISLQRTMQAYEKIPDIQSLTNKMGLLTQFIRRDMQAPSPTGVGSDSQLVGQALKFLMVLVRIPELKPAMDDDFCSFILDRIIQVAADASMPKTIINTHLALLMMQNFRPKSMTELRASKILDVLDNIDTRVSGYSVQAYRIKVYRKLIQQRPEVMIKHTERWFKQTVKSMLSCQKDINQSALDNAQTAAKMIGSDHQVTKSVLSVLNRVKTDGTTFAKYMCLELERMLRLEEVAVLVPQIWGAVTAFLRESLEVKIFTAMDDWLRLFEKFFHSDNVAVKHHANIAFNSLAYAVNITQSTPRNWSNFLLSIAQQQLQRRNYLSKSQIDSATAGYCTLLYYALRPTGSHEQLDRYWQEYIADFWKPLVHSSSSKNAVAACRVASGLFDGSRKPWNEQRALELKPQPMVQREELPFLDPRWVRRSLAPILKFVETLLDTTPWTSDAGDDEPAKKLWISLLDSLVEASSKEVMASTETKDAVAHIVNLLRRIWDRHTSKLAMPQQKEDNWADKFCFLIETVVQKLGAFQFSDKCLTQNDKDEFEVAPTPSHRSRQHGPRLSPLLYFIELLVSRSEGKLSDPIRLRVVQLVLEPCLRSRNIRLSKLELLKDCASVVKPSSKSTVAVNFCDRIATLTTSCIQDESLDPNERFSRQLGKEYEAVVDILALGSPYLLSTPAGKEVLESFVDTVRREAGEGAVVLAVVEKVSQSILEKIGEKDSSGALSYAAILLRSLPKSIARRTLEQGRQNLWPSSPTPARTHEFDPYNHFYTAIISISSSSYRKFDTKAAENAKNFITALATSLQQCPISHLTVFLRRIQDSICPWIEDPERKLQVTEECIKQLYREILNLWQSVSAAVERLPRKTGVELLALEPLITSGFVSRRRGIVNVSIRTWNETFGKEESLRYPSRLEQALQRLHNAVEISLPSFPEHDEDVGDRLSFYDSDADGVGSNIETQSPRVRDSLLHVRKIIRNSRSQASSGTSRRVPSRPTPKVRLRHENSQTQFKPIISSPTNPMGQESQILTERQKAMIEQQKLTANMFPEIGSTPDSQPKRNISGPSPLELCSDATSTDELPDETSRTPLKTLTSLGPMDMYLGSSPTPQARPRSQQILSAKSSVTTPNAVRTVRLGGEIEDMGSSPPRFEKGMELNSLVGGSNGVDEDTVDDSFEFDQPERHPSVTFDEDATVNEEVITQTTSKGQLEEAESSDDDLPSGSDFSDLPSPTVDMQLTAQITADIRAQNDSTAVKKSMTHPEPQQESNNVFVDAPSQQLLLDTINEDSTVEESMLQRDMVGRQSAAGNDAEVAETQFTHLEATENEEPAASSTEVSRVGDSFSNSVANLEPSDNRVPQVQNLRRSSRASITSSPGRRSIGKKRKQSPVNSASKAKRSKKETTNHPQKSPSSTPAQDEDDDGMLDCIVVAVKDVNTLAATPEPSSTMPSPAIKKESLKVTVPNATSPRRKSKRLSQGGADSQLVPDATNRKRSIRRSASLLSQVETHSETVLVEDTPAPKRPRKSDNKDVSEAKTTPKNLSVSQTKRLSHVQIPPRHSSSRSSSVVRGSSTAVEVDEAIINQSVAQPDTPMSVGERNANAGLHVERDTTVAVETEQSQPSTAPEGAATPNRSFTERVILTPRGLLGRLKKLVSDCSQMVFSRQEERELDDALFDLRREVHAAGRRGEECESDR